MSMLSLNTTIFAGPSRAADQACSEYGMGSEWVGAPHKRNKRPTP